MAEPIADLRYRGYEGDLQTPTHRWAVVAKFAIRESFKRKGYWLWVAFSSWYFVVLLIALWFVNQAQQNAPIGEVLGGISWADQFLHGYSYGQFSWLAVALIVGAGAIASDNKANALLMILSKPVSKRDYLIGKFVGAWVPLLVAMAVPSLIFYTYGALNYRELGFVSSDPWLVLKLVAFLICSSAFQTAIVLGISSLFQNSLAAGGTYAAIYLLSYLFNTVINVLRVTAQEASAQAAIAENLSYGSILGVTRGLAKVILGGDGSVAFAFIPGNDGDGGISEAAPPQFAAIFAIAFGIAALLLFVGWRRVNAVEVVK